MTICLTLPWAILPIRSGPVLCRRGTDQFGYLSGEGKGGHVRARRKQSDLQTVMARTGNAVAANPSQAATPILSGQIIVFGDVFVDLSRPPSTVIRRVHWIKGARSAPEAKRDRDLRTPDQEIACPNWRMLWRCCRGGLPSRLFRVMGTGKNTTDICAGKGRHGRAAHSDRRHAWFMGGEDSLHAWKNAPGLVILVGNGPQRAGAPLNTDFNGRGVPVGLQFGGRVLSRAALPCRVGDGPKRSAGQSCQNRLWRAVSLSLDRARAAVPCPNSIGCCNQRAVTRTPRSSALLTLLRGAGRRQPGIGQPEIGNARTVQDRCPQSGRLIGGLLPPFHPP